MSDSIVISIDAMGGDHGPAVAVPGVALALARLAAERPDGRPARFLLFGDEILINVELAKNPVARAVCEVRATDKVIAADEKAATALRRGKGSSLWNAVEAVKSGEAGAAISGGNTGALMAISKLLLRMTGGLDRPAIVASWPTLRGVTAVLDVGANIESDAAQLVEFAVMGEAFHRAVYGVARPTVGILNVGSEDQKGHEDVREAHRILRESGLEIAYHGFVEGDDIAKGTVDVIVTDGFSGNIALKTAEGLARFVRSILRDAFTSGWQAKLGALIAAPALRRIRDRLDPSLVNGGPLLGLNGIVVKSHGGADARGFANAVKVAYDLAVSDYAAQIDRNMKQLAQALPGPGDEDGQAAASVENSQWTLRESAVLRSVVTGVGGFLPENAVTNVDLEKFVDTNDAWIVERTGIRVRRRAAEGEFTSDLALEAAKKALAAAGRDASEVDLIIVATTTPDLTFPATAAIVQRKLGAPVGIAFDVQAVCSGFVYAMSVADGFVARGLSRCALVIGAETMSRLMDWSDRGTCVLFGDGAGAVVVEPMQGQGTTADRGLLGFALRADGTKQDLLYVDGGPSSTGTVGKLRMVGNQVFKNAVINIAEAVEAAAQVAGVTIDEVDWFIPHQANQRILAGVAHRLGVSEDRVISTVAEHANTSAASIPLAMAKGIEDGRIKPGQMLLMEAMGGGLTWGACVLRL